MFVRKSKLDELNNRLGLLEDRITACEKNLTYTVYEEWFEKLDELQKARDATIMWRSPTVDFNLKYVVNKLAEHCGLSISGKTEGKQIVIKRKKEES